MSHTLTARIGIEERADGTVTYVIQKVLKRVGVEEHMGLEMPGRNGVSLLPSVDQQTLRHAEEKPKRVRATPPKREKSFWEGIFSSLFGADAGIVRVLFDPKSLDKRANEEFWKAEATRNHVEYGYKTVAVTRRVAPYVRRRMEYEHALEVYTLKSHEYEVNMGRPYEQVVAAAREVARLEYERVQTEMRQPHQRSEQERAGVEFAGCGQVTIGTVASIRTEFTVGSLWVRPNPSGERIELSRYLADLRAAGIHATVSKVQGYSTVWDGQEGYELSIRVVAVSVEAVPDTSPVTESQWRFALQDIKNRHPAVWIKGKDETRVGIVQVASVPDPLPANSPELQRFIGEVQKRHGAVGFRSAAIAQQAQASGSRPTTSPAPKTGSPAKPPLRRRTLEDDE